MNDLERLKEIKVLLKTGQIDYDEAKSKAKPLIDNMNFIVLRVAKEHKVKPKFISFVSFMR